MLGVPHLCTPIMVRYADTSSQQQLHMHSWALQILNIFSVPDNFSVLDTLSVLDIFSVLEAMFAVRCCSNGRPVLHKACCWHKTTCGSSTVADTV